MTHCTECGERLRRIHRRFAEKFLYQAVYECQQCRKRGVEPRWYLFSWGEYPRCPCCGTYRLRRLAERDRIDPLSRNPIHLLQGLFGASLYHCRYCRIQFYDLRRRLAPERGTTASPAVSAQGDAAKPV